MSTGAGRRSRPVASAVPSRMTPQPASITALGCSPSTNAPQPMAKAGIKKVTEIARVEPTLAMSLNYST